MSWLKERSKEPTTWLGLSQLVLALGYLLKVKEAPAIAEAIHMASGSLTTGDYVTGGVALLGGLAGALLREKGGR